MGNNTRTVMVVAIVAVAIVVAAIAMRANAVHVKVRNGTNLAEIEIKGDSAIAPKK